MNGIFQEQEIGSFVQHDKKGLPILMPNPHSKIFEKGIWPHQVKRSELRAYFEHEACEYTKLPQDKGVVEFRCSGKLYKFYCYPDGVRGYLKQLDQFVQNNLTLCLEG